MRLLLSFLMILSTALSAQQKSIASDVSVANSLSLIDVSKAMIPGWNLGNTLEAIGGETAWGNPTVTQKLIDAVKAAGFRSVRLPVAWDNHANQTSNIIDAAWMARVKEVVDYCIKDNLYVMLNIHWDNGWLENNCNPDKKESVNAKQKKYWTQIATYFKEYDEHLLFASANEPNVENATQMAVLMSYHTTFIDAVRATGGNNTSRILIVQGPSTDIDKTNKVMTSMPADPTANRLMFEIHFYTPWNFCGLTDDASWGKMFYFWGQGNHSTANTSRNPTWGEEQTIDTLFRSMKTKFVDKGIPVIVGEFGAIKRTSLSGTDLSLHTASREYYYKYVSATAKKNGLIPVYWDNGVLENGFSLFNRTTGAVVDRGALTALIDGAGSSTGIATGGSRNHGEPSIPSYTFTQSHGLMISDPASVKSIAVFNQQGRCVKMVKCSSVQNTIPAKLRLGSGVYLVRIQGTDGTETVPFITVSR